MSDDVPTGEPAAHLAPFLRHLRARGVVFDVAAPLPRDPDQPGHPHGAPQPTREFVVAGLPPIIERRRGRIGSDHATWSVAADIVRQSLVGPGDTVWEIGAGTALLAIVAHHRGASRIVVTDVDADALEVARENLVAAGARAHLHAGSLLDAVPTDQPPADLVIANLPHKPSRDAGVLPLAEDGGPDGDTLLAPFFAQATERLAPGGRVVFFQHSLPHPRNLAALNAHFDVRMLSWKRRLLAPSEYGDLQDWFVERSRGGTSYVGEATDGQRYLVACVWLATRR